MRGGRSGANVQVTPLPAADGGWRNAEPPCPCIRPTPPDFHPGPPRRPALAHPAVHLPAPLASSCIRHRSLDFPLQDEPECHPRRPRIPTLHRPNRQTRRRAPRDAPRAPRSNRNNISNNKHPSNSSLHHPLPSLRLPLLQLYPPRQPSSIRPSIAPSPMNLQPWRSSSSHRNPPSTPRRCKASPLLRAPFRC